MSRAAPSSRRVTKGEYIETDTGNKISRRSNIEGKQNIMLGGRSIIMTGVHLRGDLCRQPDKAADGEKEGATTYSISIGRGTVLATNCTIRPPMRMSKGQMTYYPVQIGNNVFIGPGSEVSAIAIASHVHVGAGCVLGAFCALRESCRVLPGSVVAPHTVVPPGCVVAGRPARIVGEVGDGWGQGGGGGEGEEWVEGGDLRALVRSIK